MIIHRQNFHTTTSNSPTPLLDFKCEFCGVKFNNETSFKVHKKYSHSFDCYKSVNKKTISKMKSSPGSPNVEDSTNSAMKDNKNNIKIEDNSDIFNNSSTSPQNHYAQQVHANNDANNNYNLLPSHYPMFLQQDNNMEMGGYDSNIIRNEVESVSVASGINNQFITVTQFDSNSNYQIPDTQSGDLSIPQGFRLEDVRFGELGMNENGSYTVVDPRSRARSQGQGSQGSSQETPDILDLDSQEVVQERQRSSVSYQPFVSNQIEASYIQTQPSRHNESSLFDISQNRVPPHHHQPQQPFLESSPVFHPQPPTMVQPIFQEQHHTFSIADRQPGPSHQHSYPYTPPVMPFNGTNHNQLAISPPNTNMNPGYNHQSYNTFQNYSSPMPMMPPSPDPQVHPDNFSPPQPVAGPSRGPRAGPSRLSHLSPAMNAQPHEHQAGPATPSTSTQKESKKNSGSPDKKKQTHFCEVCKKADGLPRGFTSSGHKKRHSRTKIHETALKEKNLWTAEMEAIKVKTEADEANAEANKKSTAKKASKAKAADQKVEKATKVKKKVAKKSEEASTSNASQYPIVPPSSSMSHALSHNFSGDNSTNTNSPPQTEFIPQPGPSSQIPPAYTIIPAYQPSNLGAGYSQAFLHSDLSRPHPFNPLFTSLQAPQLHHAQNFATTSSPMSHHQLQAAQMAHHQAQEQMTQHQAQAHLAHQQGPSQITYHQAQAQLSQNNHQQAPPAYQLQAQPNSTSSPEHLIRIMTIDENGQNNSNPTEDEQMERGSNGSATMSATSRGSQDSHQGDGDRGVGVNRVQGNHRRRPQRTTGPVTCPICGKTVTSSAYLIQHHKAVHTGKTERCEKCGKLFKDTAALNAHKETHDKRNHKHKCETCGLSYANMCSLKKHSCKINKNSIPVKSGAFSRGDRVEMHKSQRHPTSSFNTINNTVSDTSNRISEPSGDLPLTTYNITSDINNNIVSENINSRDLPNQMHLDPNNNHVSLASNPTPSSMNFSTGSINYIPNLDNEIKNLLDCNNNNSSNSISGEVNDNNNKDPNA